MLVTGDEFYRRAIEGVYHGNELGDMSRIGNPGALAEIEDAR